MILCVLEGNAALAAAQTSYTDGESGMVDF